MPSIDWNKNTWGKYHWTDDGHEWSRRFGGAEAQWINTIYPRIHRLLPARSILEIAPGHGRWTAFLLNHAAAYHGIDIAASTVEHCRRAYAPLKIRPRFHLGDGFHLNGIRDGSISLVFSYDSLVHVEMDTIASYAPEIHRVLEPGGYAFIHHSNLAEYVDDGKLTIAEPTGGRGTSVSAESASAAFRSAGLMPLIHEKVQWRFSYYGDCFSLVRKPALDEPAAEDPPQIFRNELFPAEIKISRLLGERYGAVVSPSP